MNIATRLFLQAKERPKKIALKVPFNETYKELTFDEVENIASQYAISLEKQGLRKGTKTLLFVRPGLDFPSLTFALFKIGAVPIFIDPGMGRKNLLNAIKQVQPEAMISVPEVHIARLLFPKAFKSIRFHVTTGKLKWGKMTRLDDMRSDSNERYEPKEVTEEDLAAILFTSGGTGIPKGVEYTHNIFNKQTDLLQNMFNLTDEDVDVPGFPLFSLFTMAMGMTSCPPDMDPSKPAKADPKKLVKNINDHKATFVAGSPAIWEKVGIYCKENNLTLPSVKYLVMFGAPVSLEIHQNFKDVLTNGTTYTPYGATESLPVSSISGKEVIESTSELTQKGRGTCVGKPILETKVKIIEINDDPINSLDKANELPPNQIGEIIVQGPTVTKRYYHMPEKTAESKIYDGANFWHRIGDLGYLDEEGRIWFCGRKTHRVETSEELLSSVQCEAIFNQHHQVKRSALIGIGKLGNQKPAIVIERRDGQIIKGQRKEQFETELISLAKRYQHTKDINTIYLAKDFPVDVRHNIKIDRLKLQSEATRGRLS